MRHPFETWPATGRRAWVWTLVVLTLVIGAALGLIGVELDEGGFLGLEMARSHERVGEILGAWERDGALGLGAFGLGLDMAWLLVYGPLFATLAAMAAMAATRARDAGRPRLAGALVVAAWAALAAAGLDVLENACQVPYFDDPTAGWPQGAATFATAKFALLLYAIGMPLVGRLVTRRA